MLSFVGVTTAIRDVSELVGLVGAIGMCNLAMMPSLAHLTLTRAGALTDVSRVRVALDVLNVAFCAIIMVTGTISAVQEIVSSW